MIELKNVSKTFLTDSGSVEALKNINLSIRHHEIFGIIGFSGAGKSTLVRCINLLERPTTGEVYIDGIVLTDLKEPDLRIRRKKIGMIFQHFNLMNARTIHDNIAFPLKGQGLSKETINKKVVELLKLVELEDKAHHYPRQLSGGQKQRVGIARALANDPDILLCDEATSALDPQTTKNILKLLKSLNEKLGLTIIVITHEMDVVKDICDRVAVMENGEIKEINTVKGIFSNPHAPITSDFVNSTRTMDSVIRIIHQRPEILGIDGSQHLVKIEFFGSNTKESVISSLSIKYGIHASIIHANVEIIQDEIIGSMLLLLSGSRKNEALEALKKQDVKVEVIVL